MKILKIFIVIVIALVLNNALFAQYFQEVGNHSFANQSFSTEASFGDIDGDNDIDILSGKTLFYNRGAGDFVGVVIPALDTFNSVKPELLDIDGDGDMDIVAFVQKSNNDKFLILRNDGALKYIDITTPNFGAVSYSNGIIKAVDIDGDNDMDIIVSGTTTILYLNDGTGIFTQASGVSLINSGLNKGNITVGDVDGDNDADILIVGDTIDLITNPEIPAARLYINNNLTFVETDIVNYNLGFYKRKDCTFGDIDGDNDLDLLIATESSTASVINIYNNDGNGNFSLTSDTLTPFTTFIYACELADIDGDNDLDLFAMDLNNLTIYTNDGAGKFTNILEKQSSFGGFRDFKLADIDGDNDIDYFIGNSSEGIFVNDGTGKFDNYSFKDGGIAISDIDGDNDFDFISCGPKNTLLYINDGLGNFESKKDTNLYDFYSYGKPKFADLDGDGDDDLIATDYIVGIAGGFTINKQYVNDGNGKFTEKTNTPFIGNFFDFDFSDFNNDGYLDILFVGNSNDSVSTELYLNDGTGNFVEKYNTPFINLSFSSLALADVDGDNDVDAIMTGNTSTTQLTQLYLNDGSGNFSISPKSFYATNLGDLAFIDMDSDGDNDLIISGGDSTVLYENDGSGNFNVNNSSSFKQLQRSKIHCFDYDNDQDQDIFITGEISSTKNADLYINDGTGQFTILQENSIRPTRAISIVTKDLNNDNYEDIIMAGAPNGKTSTFIYYNKYTSFVKSFIGNNLTDTIALGSSQVICWGQVKPNVTITIDTINFPKQIRNLIFNTNSKCFNYEADSLGTDSLVFSVIDLMLQDTTVFTYHLTVERGVWPGDTDTSQVVNNFDLLNIGLGFGSIGIPRDSTSIIWNGFVTDDWGITTPISGVDYKHLDCNGDGIINATDTNAIVQNWDLSYSYKKSGAGSIPLYLNTNIIVDSSSISIPIMLGDALNQAANIYGVAFSITYDTDLVKPNSARVEFDSSWLANNGQFLSLYKDFYSDSLVQVAITRFDGMSSTGFGQIGTLNLTIQDDILQKDPLFNPLKYNFTINTIKAIDEAENPILVFGGTNLLAIDTSTTTKQLDISKQVAIYPNPATNQVTIKTNNLNLESIQLLNLSGQIVQETHNLNGRIHQLQVNQHDNGLYFLQILTDKGVVTKKVMILK